MSIDTIEKFDFNIDTLTAILWQYDQADNLKQLLTDKNSWLAEYYTQFWNDWIFDVFDLRTANLFGLTIWSIILDFPLYVSLTPLDPAVPLWGFNAYLTPPPPPFDLENTYQNFENGNLAPANTLSLTEDEQRIVLQLRYYQLVTRGAVGATDALGVNQFLNYVFGDLGGVWMLDNLDMTITYVFNYTPSNNLLDIIESNFLLPKPAGVALNYILPP